MQKFPFQISIKNSLTKQSQSLTCNAVLRSIAGKREVYRADWGRRKVIAKIFYGKISSTRHAKKEWRGLTLLQKRGISAPEPLFQGKAGDGGIAIVTEEIADSLTILEVLQKITDEKVRLDLLVKLCAELARQHKKGVLQKDLHFGNYLLADEKIFSLDAGQMKFLNGPADKKKSIRQLATLTCFLDSDTRELLYRQYARQRDWSFSHRDDILFGKYLNSHRKKMTRTCLKKTLRTSKRELKIRTDKCVAVFEKSFLGNCDGRDLIDHIDQLMEKGQIFKDGNTCYVSRLRFNGSDIVIKRYNHKGLIYSLRHTIKKSRGRRSWLNAHRLGILRIPTAGPVGFIEQMNGPIVWKSYFVTRYLEGQKLHDFLRDSNVTKQQRTKVIDQCRELLGKLDENLITHGDLKHTNILIGDDGPMLLDLDGMKAHKFKWFHKIRHAKDLSRIGVL